MTPLQPRVLGSGLLRDGKSGSVGLSPDCKLRMLAVQKSSSVQAFASTLSPCTHHFRTAQQRTNRFFGHYDVEFRKEDLDARHALYQRLAEWGSMMKSDLATRAVVLREERPVFARGLPVAACESSRNSI